MLQHVSKKENWPDTPQGGIVVSHSTFLAWRIGEFGVRFRHKASKFLINPCCWADYCKCVSLSQHIVHVLLRTALNAPHCKLPLWSGEYHLFARTYGAKPWSLRPRWSGRWWQSTPCVYRYQQYIGTNTNTDKYTQQLIHACKNWQINK